MTKNDLIRQTFTVGGNGGAGKDTSNTGVRLIHSPSKTSGEGRSQRSQKQNEIEAFKNLCSKKGFITWIKIETRKAQGLGVRESLEEMMKRVDKDLDEAIRTGQVIIEEL